MFICHGNICRSPMGRHFLMNRRFIKKVC
ncbi:MAG: hypothetical protein LUG88_02870 [Clostridia bacterium]|nr:hypothetical protein [Clostridia bacterium]